MPRQIDPTSDRPVYRQIADQLRDAIREGRYPEGSALPSESALADTYGVTRMTARQAVEVLKTEGLVRSEHGRGVFVRQRPTIRRLARPWSLAEGTQMVEPDSGPGGIYSRLADIGHGPVRFTEEVSTRLASPEGSRFLGLTAPAPVFYLVRTAFDGENRPVEICEHVMSGERWHLTYEWHAD